MPDSHDRHELHRTVDGDWPPEARARADVRRGLFVIAAGALATAASITALTLAPELPPGVSGIIAALPILALGITAARV